jgi:hypothetical protein
MMDREFHFQNKFEKLVHLVGFIVRKFVTMRGHMNVKKKRLDVLFTSAFPLLLVRICFSRIHFCNPACHLNQSALFTQSSEWIDVRNGSVLGTEYVNITYVNYRQ